MNEIVVPICLLLKREGFLLSDFLKSTTRFPGFFFYTISLCIKRQAEKQ